MNLRKRIKSSDKKLFRAIREFYYFLRKFSIPAPRILWRPIWLLFNFICYFYYWTFRVFWVTPIFKGLCERIGENFSAGTFMPFLIGNGKIIIGDRVTFHGKADFVFGSIKTEIPEIHIGHQSDIGHNVRFDVSGKLIIGDNCLIAKDVAFHDSSGHHIDPELRRANIPIGEKQVRPITIGNNVWIGDGAYISPGTTIGDNCVISTGTIVGRKIPDNSIVYSSPSKVVKIRKLSSML
jgi:acetyltransferase-like isoleucine patch superfamily enzyme